MKNFRTFTDFATELTQVSFEYEAVLRRQADIELEIEKTEKLLEEHHDLKAKARALDDIRAALLDGAKIEDELREVFRERFEKTLLKKQDFMEWDGGHIKMSIARYFYDFAVK